MCCFVTSLSPSFCPLIMPPTHYCTRYPWPFFSLLRRRLRRLNFSTESLAFLPPNWKFSSYFHYCLTRGCQMQHPKQRIIIASCWVHAFHSQELYRLQRAIAVGGSKCAIHTNRSNFWNKHTNKKKHMNFCCWQKKQRKFNNSLKFFSHSGKCICIWIQNFRLVCFKKVVFPFYLRFSTFFQHISNCIYIFRTQTGVFLLLFKRRREKL